MTTRREEAALRVRGLHPPLPALFAALRAEQPSPAPPSRPAADRPAAAPPDPPAPAPDSPVTAAPTAVAPPGPPTAAPADSPALAPDPPDTEPAETGAPAAEPDAEPPADPADPLAVALAAAATEPGLSEDDLVLRLALAVEDTVGVDSLDVLLAVLQPYAATLVAGTSPDLPADLPARLRGVARSAAVVAATRSAGRTAVQRFGDPYCPRPGCYGRDGAPLDDAWVAANGLPPYGDGCNCTATPPPAPPRLPPAATPPA
jgi:hypothetical protein